MPHAIMSICLEKSFWLITMFDVKTLTIELSSHLTLQKLCIIVNQAQVLIQCTVGMLKLLPTPFQNLIPLASELIFEKTSAKNINKPLFMKTFECLKIKEYFTKRMMSLF